MRRRNWTQDELLLAFNLYHKLPFGSYHSKNDDIIELASLIERTPSAVAMKLSNFVSLDPEYEKRGISGLTNRSKADEETWHKFTNDWDNTVLLGEQLLFQLRANTLGVYNKQRILDPQLDEDFLIEQLENKNTTGESIANTRIGQSFFRKMILAIYQSQCCICGISIPGLLVASHIIPWKEAEELRLNPRNGLCLCSLHHTAFDLGLISIQENYQITISDRIMDFLPNQAVGTFIQDYHGRQMLLPDRFLPDPEYLNHHFRVYFLND